MTTGFAPTFTKLRPVRGVDPSLVVVSDDWQVVGEWQCNAPATVVDGGWHVSVSVDIDGDDDIAGGVRLRTSTGEVSAVLPVSVPLQRATLEWTPISTVRTRVYLEMRRGDGDGGLRVLRAAGVAMWAPPGWTPPAADEGVEAVQYRGSWQSDTAATTHTVSPSDISPAPVAGDCILILGAAAGTTELSSFSYQFPGAPLFNADASALSPRIFGSVVDYDGDDTTDWTISGSSSFQATFVALSNCAAVRAGTPQQGTSPLTPAGLDHDVSSLGLVYTVLNTASSTVTLPPPLHTTVVQSSQSPRQRHLAVQNLTSVGTYSPGPATVGPNVDDTSTVALVAEPVIDTIDPPTVPTFNTGSAITLNTLSADIAAAVAAEAAGTHFKLIDGTYTNWNGVRPKEGMYFQGPDTGTAVLEGTGFDYAFRALDFDGTGDNVTISQNIKIQNYGNGTTRTDYGAIQGHPTDTANNEWAYGAADNWFIHDVELATNSGGGIAMSDNCTVYACVIYGHSNAGLSANRNVGGYVYGNTIEANGFNPTTGQFGTGWNIAFEWHNASLGRSEVLPVSALRRTNTLYFAENTINATRVGITGESFIGLFCNVDSRFVKILNNAMSDCTLAAVLVTGCNNVLVQGNTISNTDGDTYGVTENYTKGAITIGESTNCFVRNNTISDSVLALVHRQSNRSGENDWYNPSEASGLNFAWPTGTRYWISADGPEPIPSLTDGSNIWTGNNWFQNNTLINCGKVYIAEGPDTSLMATVGSTPLNYLYFTGNNYNASSGILFYDRSTVGLTLTQWRALPFVRDQYQSGDQCQPSFRSCPYSVPDTSGMNRVEVTSLASFDSVKNTVGPNDLIVFTQNVTLTGTERFEVLGQLHPNQDASSGTASQPILITADPGVVVGSSNYNSTYPVFDLRGCEHWGIINMTIEGGYFNIRLQGCKGTVAAPIVIAGNECRDSGQAHIVCQDIEASLTTTNNVRIYLNEVHGVGVPAGPPDPQFCEGIYLGTGDLARTWEDRSSGFYVGFNDIYDLVTDPIDLKAGVTDVLVEGNDVHDFDISSGTNPVAGISCIYGSGTVPVDMTDAQIEVRYNRIWNMTTAFSRAPIGIGFGGVNVHDNLMWEYGTSSEGVRLRSEAPFGLAPIYIQCNTMGGRGWNDPGVNEQTDVSGPGALTTITSSGNLYNGTYQGEYVHSAADFVGPTTGTADAGLGVGSGWMLETDSGANNTGSCEGLMQECV